MHYYKRHLGDYAKKAGRLSMLQHGAYNLLIDACYDREQFPTTDEAIDWVWASTEAEVEAVHFVLRKFFTQNNNGQWVQKRIQNEVAEYQELCERQAENGKKGGRPKKPSGLNKKPSGNPVGFSENPVETHRGQKKTLTTNHKTNKPLTNARGSTRARTLEQDLTDTSWAD